MSPPSRQQIKNPTSMRYERVQAILEADDFIASRLGEKSHCVEDRFSERNYFAPEVVRVTDALHSEGKDATKASKGDILKAAARILHLIPGPASNGDSAPGAPPAPPAPPAPVNSPVKAASKTAAKAPKPEEPKKAKPEKAKPEPKPEKAKKAVISVPPKKSSPVKAAKALVKEPVKEAATAKESVKEPVKEPPKAQVITPPAKKASVEQTAKPSAKAVEASEQIPESELPAELRPLKLPPGFDFSDYPHYSVQSSIYSLLLSALNMAEHYERFPNMEERQKKIEEAIKAYQDTCDPLKIKA